MTRRSGRDYQLFIYLFVGWLVRSLVRQSVGPFLRSFVQIIHSINQSIIF